MAARFQAAGEIDRQATAAPRLALARHAPALSGFSQAHRLIFDHFGNGEAIMRLDQIEIIEIDTGCSQRLGPDFARAFESNGIAPRQGQKIIDLLARPEADGAVQRLRSFTIGDHQGGGTIRHQRAIGAPQRPGNAGVFVRNGVAEFKAEILAHVGKRIAHAVGVVFGSNHRQFLRAVAVALEISIGNAPEYASKSGVDLCLLAPVACRQQDVADFGRRRRRHFFSTHHQSNSPAPALNEIQRRMDRRRSGGAGVFDMDGGGVGEFGNGERYQRGLETLAGKAIVIDADGDGIDIAGANARMLKGRGGNAGNQALGIGIVELAEGRVGPADDGGGVGHGLGLPFNLAQGCCSGDQDPCQAKPGEFQSGQAGGSTERAMKNLPLSARLELRTKYENLSRAALQVEGSVGQLIPRLYQVVPVSKALLRPQNFYSIMSRPGVSRPMGF